MKVHYKSVVMLGAGIFLIFAVASSGQQGTAPQASPQGAKKAPAATQTQKSSPRRAPLEVPQARPTIAVHQALLAVCRPRGIPVIYTKFLAGPERTLIWDWSPQVAPPVCCCWKGFLRFYEDVGKELDCADIIDEIYPEPGDPIVDKFGYGAFHNTNLDDLLKARHVESVLITGTVTQICVEETARESFKRGYPTTLVSDAVSTYAPDLQTAVLKNFAHKFGWVSTAKEVIAALESLAIR